MVDKPKPWTLEQRVKSQLADLIWQVIVQQQKIDELEAAAAVTQILAPPKES